MFLRKLHLLKSKINRDFLLLSLLESLMQSNLDANFLGKSLHHKRFWITGYILLTNPSLSPSLPGIGQPILRTDHYFLSRGYLFRKKKLFTSCGWLKKLSSSRKQLSAKQREIFRNTLIFQNFDTNCTGRKSIFQFHLIY